MKKNKLIKNKLQYEPEADVLTLETSNKPIEYVKEIGNIVVHFDQKDTPVLFEILEASRFLKKAEDLVERSGISH